MKQIQSPRRPLPSRRRFMLAGLSGLAAILATTMDAEAAKVSKAKAHYQGMPHNGQRCSHCQHFKPPTKCELVEGVISPVGWCKFFAAKAA